MLPQSNIYTQKKLTAQDHVPDDNELVVTPDMQDNYVGAKVYLSFGGDDAL